MSTAPSSCNASNIQIVMPTTIINSTSYDTLEAMVVSCSPSLLQGSPVVTSINMGGGERKRSRMEAQAEEEDDMMMEDEFIYTGSDSVYKPEKKRRLSPEQVRRLERSFEVENKLEPERKLELAKELRLHPRQVAVWFQNRRARWKTKQLEKDYDALKLSYTALQAHFDALHHEKQELHQQVVSLREKLKQQGDQYHAREISIGKESKLLVKVEEGSRKLDGDQIKSVDNPEELQGAHVTELSKQRDGGGAGMKSKLLLLQEREVSSGTEGSAVSEAINSPRAIDSGVNSKEDSINCAEMNTSNDLLTSTNPNYLSSSSSSCGAAAAAASCSAPLKSSSSSAGDHQLGTVLPTILSLDPFMHVKAEMESEDEIYSKCCFILEDQGSFPWWNTTSWA